MRERHLSVASLRALTRNRTPNHLVYGMMLQPNEPPSQGNCWSLSCTGLTVRPTRCLPHSPSFKENTNNRYVFISSPFIFETLSHTVPLNLPEPVRWVSSPDGTPSHPFTSSLQPVCGIMGHFYFLLCVFLCLFQIIDSEHILFL